MAQSPFDKFPMFGRTAPSPADDLWDGKAPALTWREREATKAAAPVAVIEATPKEPAGPPGSLASIHNVYADPFLPNKVRFDLDAVRLYTRSVRDGTRDRSGMLNSSPLGVFSRTSR
jgi:hypothetical protein